jgi:Domain of unknown function (DUF4335)
MDNNLTTHTYTTPTCTLIVSSKEQQRSLAQKQFEPIDFVLQLDPPDGDELDRVTLSGQSHQLDYLHQIVSQYIKELVAKFPLPNTIDRTAPAATAPAPLEVDATGLNSQPDPQHDSLASRLGILKNLPGLRNSLAKLTPVNNADADDNFAAKPSISRLLGGNRQPDHRQQQHPEQIEPPLPEHDPTMAPYLTGTGNRSLEHQLHLGTLTNRTSGEVVTLSAIQLFDLATVLDEYVAEHITTTSHDPVATLSRANIPTNGNRANESSTTAASRSPLPNFTPEPDPSKIYYRNRRSQSSLISALPWAAAAALAVGVPLLMLDPNPNPLKDAVSQVKLFDPPAKTKKSNLVTGNKSNPATLPGTPTTTTNPSTIATAPTVASPTPWLTQPVTPPQAPKPLPPSLTPPPSSTQLGTAPLPEAIATTPGSSVPPTIASTGAKPAIAPNPLNSTQSSSAPTQIDNTIARPTATTPAAKPGATRIGAGTSARTPNPALIVPSDETIKPATKPIAPGKLSVSKRPMLIPSPNLSPIPTPSISAPIPFNPPAMELPNTPTPQAPKKAAKPIKPTTAAATPKPVKSAESDLNPSPSFDPTPGSRNPNLITPSPTNSEPPESQTTPPIVPDRPLQSNASADGGDSAALQETRRYFQGKWKANAAQTNSLQYVLQVSGKSGIVRTVSPQGEAATSYLQQTKFIKPGQKLVSPAAAGTSDQKIRVLLQPDGNVDTFTEP